MTRKPIDVTSMDPSQTPGINAQVEQLYRESATIRYVSDEPTIKTVSQNELVIYDNGAGTKRLYTITAKGNLGYVILT